MKGDFTRFTHHPRKHYTQVRKQQGRVDLDADWNEYADIQSYLQQVRTRDVIGPCGAPLDEAGFKIKPTDDGKDVSISAGRYYVQGVLCELEAPTAYQSQPYLPQPPALKLEAGKRILFYLDVWKRHITAIEDPAIREKALGGPDTTTRVQTIWQVRAMEADDWDCRTIAACRDEEKSLSGWPPIPPLEARGKLSNTLDPANVSSDPCLIEPEGGYVGLENRLYRVEIHDPGRLGQATFKWSRDNGSVVFAISEFVAGEGTKIRVARLGRDQILALHVNDWVEISSDETELAGHSGILTKIIRIDHATNTLTLGKDVSAFANYSHPKVRRWDQPSPAIATSASSIPLEDGLSVRFHEGRFQAGDYWVFAARAIVAEDKVEALEEAPPLGNKHYFCPLAIITWRGSGLDEETEKRLATLRAAVKEIERKLEQTDDANARKELKAKVEELQAEIAEILEESGGAEEALLPVVSDCRHVFPPLNALQTSCCTVTVGDGVRSCGQFNDLQAAIDYLPRDGGKVCLLPGDHLLERPVIIEERRNVIISGCHGQARVDIKGAEPALLISRCASVTVSDITFTGEIGAAVAVNESRDVTFDENKVVMHQKGTQQKLPAVVLVTHSHQVRIVANEIETVDQIAILVHGEEIVVQRNRVEGGGVVALAGSSDLQIIDNQIGDGVGHGITFALADQLRPDSPKETLIEAEDTDVSLWMSRSTMGVDQKRYVLRHVVIRNNDIRSMEGSGIAVMRLPDADMLETIIITDDLMITGNHIMGCASGVREDDGTSIYGGIVLADGKHLHIQHNVIEACGPILTSSENGEPNPTPIIGVTTIAPADVVANSSYDDVIRVKPETMTMKTSLASRLVLQPTLRYLEPYIELAPEQKPAAPIAGVYIHHCQGLDISHNRILDNGLPQIGPLAAGRQGGVIIRNATPNPLRVAATKEKTFIMSDGYPAVKIHDNTVITPRGPALLIFGVGGMAITDNQLTSQGALPLPVSSDEETLSAAKMIASLGTVFIFNLGVADELIGQFAGFARMAVLAANRDATTDASLSITAAEGDLKGITLDGAVLFSNNQVLFNLMRAERDLAASSVSIFSLDDIGFHNNQMEVVIPQDDKVLADAIVGGLRVRAAGNVFKETFGRVSASLMSVGLINSTSFNQGNHCILAYALNSVYLKNVGNIALMCGLTDNFTHHLTELGDSDQTDEEKAAKAYLSVMDKADQMRSELTTSLSVSQSTRITALRQERATLEETIAKTAPELRILDAELKASEGLKTRLDEVLVPIHP